MAKAAWKSRRSKRTPSARVVSKARLTLSFIITAAGVDIAAIVSAVASASASSSAAGTMRETRPARSASSAPIIRPVRQSSMAFALPIARVRRCEPPIPGITPSLISGWPNLAVSAASRTSQSMANSQPPPSA